MRARLQPLLSAIGTEGAEEPGFPRRLRELPARSDAGDDPQSLQRGPGRPADVRGTLGDGRTRDPSRAVVALHGQIDELRIRLA